MSSNDNNSFQTPESNKNHPNSSEQLFMSALKLHLEALKVRNIEDILSDYREHFVHGKNSGKSEQQICEDLGNPVTIAKAYEAENLIRDVKQTPHGFHWTMVFKILGRLIVLAPINFLMLLIPGIFLAALVFAGWAATFGLATAGLAIAGIAFKASLFSLSAWIGTSALAGGLGLLGLAMVVGLTVFLFSKFILMSLINYVQWNLKFILEK